MKSQELQRFQSDLLQIVAEGAGVAGVVESLVKATESSVVVTNEFHQVLVSSHVNYPKNSFIKSSLNDTQNNLGLCQIKMGSKIEEAYLFPSYIKNKPLGFLYIFSGPLALTDIKALGEATALVLTVQLAKDKEFLVSEKRYIDAFLFDLLYGNIESGEDIIVRGKLWGWDLSRAQCVMVFELDDYDYLSGDENLLAILLDCVQSVMNEMGEKPILTKKKGEVIAVLFKSKGCKHDQIEYAKFLVEKIESLVKQRIPSRVLQMGIGRIYATAKELFRSYQEAKVALELGKLLDSRLSTPFFGNLGLARILYNHDHQELIELYKETIGELERYDRERNTDFMKTLETYLVNRCDLKETAKKSFVHPNTLRYRLKKIGEILDVDLDDFDTKLNIMVAFKIKYLKALEIDALT